MKKLKSVVKGFLTQYGVVVASCAFLFVAMSANSACVMPFYEPEEPVGLEKYKKFNK